MCSRIFCTRQVNTRIRNIYLHFYGHHHPNRRVRRVGRLPKVAQIAKKAHTQARARAHRNCAMCAIEAATFHPPHSIQLKTIFAFAFAHDLCSRPLFISNQNKHSFKYLTIYTKLFIYMLNIVTRCMDGILLTVRESPRSSYLYYIQFIYEKKLYTSSLTGK